LAAPAHGKECCIKTPTSLKHFYFDKNFESMRKLTYEFWFVSIFVGRQFRMVDSEMKNDPSGIGVWRWVIPFLRWT
jgi:hypothetical protein